MRRLLTVCLGLCLLLPAASAGPAPASDGAPLLLVANKNGDSLYFVNASSLQVTDSVATGQSPHEVAAAPERGRAYVANYAAGTITVVDVPERRIAATWSLDGYTRPHGIAVSPDEEHVYVTAEADQAVLELDAATGTVTRTFKTGKEVTHMLALSSDGTRLYATSIGSGTVSVVDLASGEVQTHVRTGEGAEGVAVRPDDGAVWITNRADDTVSILNAETATVTDTLNVSGFPIRVAFQRNGPHAIVSVPRAGEAVVFDGQDRTQTMRIETGAKPIGVLVSPRAPRAFVANSGSRSVSVVDLTGPAVTETVTVGKAPDGMAFVPAK